MRLNGDPEHAKSHSKRKVKREGNSLESVGSGDERRGDDDLRGEGDDDDESDLSLDLHTPLP